MDRIDLQKLRELPIEGVAERLGLTVKRHKALCPFHNDHHASLSFKVSRNTYRCFVCGASGGTIDLVMRYLNKDFVEACRWLADEHNVILDWGVKEVREVKEVKPFDASRYERFFERPWLNEEARKFIFDERRLDSRVVRWCRLTSWKDKQGVPWLQTPYYNREGKLVGVQNRNLVKGATPRFRFPQGAQCTIAIPSATLLNKKDVELLQALSSELSIRFEMWPDNDMPGERLFLQLQKVLPDLVHHQLPPDCKDFSEYYLSTIT